MSGALVQPSVSYWVCANGISADSLIELATHQGCSGQELAAPSNFDRHPVAGGPNRVVAQLAEADGNRLPQILNLPIAVCVEVGTEPFLGQDAADLVLVLTTATAFAADPGTAFADALIGRGLIGSARRKDLRLALHEALANGLVHGNLEIKSDPGLTPAAFLEHAAVLETRLASPDFGSRPISLTANVTGSTLEVRIRDSGQGFLPKPLSPANEHRLDGHGLNLMAKHSDGLRHENDGRQVVLVYCRDGDADGGARHV